MKNIKRLIAFIGIFIMGISLVPAYYAKADEQVSVSISSASGTVGSEVTVTVTISADKDIDGATINVSYDNSIIRPVDKANSGVVMFSALEMTSGSTVSISQNFEIIAAGTTTLAKISVNGERATISSASSGKVTAKAPASYSSDNTLKSLQISPGTLSPAFSPDRTTYNATVDADVTELVVSAAANDSAAKISISGRRMDPGSNTTTITVTAEDGSVKKYIIYTTRLEDGQEATTEAESKTEAVTEDASQAVNNDGTVTIDGRKYSVVKDYSEITIPDGYQEIDYDYNGQKINAVKGIKTGLILMYLESEDGKGGFYIYDETAKTFSPYNTVAEPEITYVVLPITNSLEKPAGYALTRFTMNGKEVQVLMDADRQYCLFYGVSSLGEKGWFRYRVSDGSIQAYSVVKSDTANADVKTDNGKTSGNSRFWLMIVLILGLIIAVFIVITIVLCSKLAKVKKVFNMASKDGVDLDEYTEKVIEGYESDEDDSYAELDTSTDTVSYGDDKSGKNDVEELKLFDVDDDK
mgnify:CR=1 FL=1